MRTASVVAGLLVGMLGVAPRAHAQAVQRVQVRIVVPERPAESAREPMAPEASPAPTPTPPAVRATTITDTRRVGPRTLIRYTRVYD